MRPPSPQSLLVEHPALPQPLERDDLGASSNVVGSLHRIDRIRIAVQLVSVTALLADFELWPGRAVIRRARVEVTGDGPRVRLPALPMSLSRVWSGLGGGDPAAESTRSAVLAAVAEVTRLETGDFEHGGTEPGFFLDGVLGRLLRQLDRPLDRATARSLWMWRWSLPPQPEIGDTSLFAVPDTTVARRLGAAVWAAAVRRGESATLEVARSGDSHVSVVETGGAPRVRVIAGSFDDQALTSIIDHTGERELATVAIGRFPHGWNPVPAPVVDDGRLSGHLTVAGLSPARRLRLIDGHTGRFDIFSPADRRSLTESAALLFAEVRHRNKGRFGDLVAVARLAPEGVPVHRALEVSGSGEDLLDEACASHVVIRRRGAVLLPSPAPMVVDPRHAELVNLFDRGDPRRLLHGALASGDTGELLAWSRRRLDALDALLVRELLADMAVGALGPGVQVALVEACLHLADIHGARKSIEGLGPEIARPWSNWLRLIDRHPEFEVEQPRPLDFHHAPRACAEIALVSLRRALRGNSKPTEVPLDLIRQALDRLTGMSKRWVEIRLAALAEPDRLEDGRWRRSVCQEHPELDGLVLFERSVRATHEGRNRFATRLLRRVMSAERAPGRLALMQVNLGVLEARLGRHRAAESLTLGAFRLFQTAGFRHRGWDALYNLAVADIDHLRVERAKARLDALAQADNTIFVQAERTRLALAVGDLDLFRSRLADLPRGRNPSTTEITQALAFLKGVEALFFQSPTAALPLLQTGGDEAVVWLELVEAIIGTEVETLETSDDGWGVGRAATMARSARRGGSFPDLGPRDGERFEVRDALSLALLYRLGFHVGEELRIHGSAVLDEHGLAGWAARLRWDGPGVEDLHLALSALVRNQGFDGLDEGTVGAILAGLGIRGLVVRSTRSGREISRVGEGRSCTVHRRGLLEIVPLGSDPGSASTWDLLGELIELTHVPGAAAGTSPGSTEVRIDGVSPEVERLRNEVRLNAKPRFAVLIHGETGSGKEVVAKELHRLSGRQGEMVSVNVAAVPAGILEAELFGSVKGAYTGADRSRRGLVAAAVGGTLFLDEVGDLDVALQVKLLRFLESGEVRAVGSDRTSRLEVRVVCATHRNLERRVREGRFRRDLFYRIALAKIKVPALRNRLQDVPILKAIFEEEAAEKHGLKISSWSAAADRRLMNHRWAGNVRELKHTVEVAMVRASGDTIRPNHLPLSRDDTVSRGTWAGALSDFKRELLNEVLTRHSGNRSAAARELGISRQALLYQLKTQGLTDL